LFEVRISGSLTKDKCGRFLAAARHLEGPSNVSLKLRVANGLNSGMRILAVVIALCAVVQFFEIVAEWEQLMAGPGRANLRYYGAEHIGFREHTGAEGSTVGLKHRPNLLNNIPQFPVEAVVKVPKNLSVGLVAILSRFFNIPFDDGVSLLKKVQLRKNEVAVGQATVNRARRFVGAGRTACATGRATGGANQELLRENPWPRKSR
jgi:hypothetical protein